MGSGEAVQRDRGRRFPTTLWTLVNIAGRRVPGADEALESLCAMYWFPLYGYARRTGHAPDSAEDLVQSYFTVLLEKNYLSEASCDKGRFRSFLLSSFKHFLSNQRDRELTAKRGGGQRIVPIHFGPGSAEIRFIVEPSHNETPDKIFDREWALVLLEQVRELLRKEFEQKGKLELFDRLQGCLSDVEPEVPYALVSKETGMSESAIKVTVHRIRRRFRDLVREQIAQTVVSQEDVDDEIRFLWAAVGG